MKKSLKLISLIIGLISVAATSLAQEKQETGTAYPTFNEIDFYTETLCIENEYFDNATIRIRPKRGSTLLTNSVTLIVTQDDGRRIYYKRFPDMYMYVYRDNIEIKNGHFRVAEIAKGFSIIREGGLW